MSDFELLVAELDRYLERLRSKLLHRLEIGERHYRGAWKEMSVGLLRQEREEELLDAVIYSLFIELKERGD